MAKKAELLEEAQKRGLEVTAKNTIAEITEAISKNDERRTSNDEAATEPTDNTTQAVEDDAAPQNSKLETLNSDTDEEVVKAKAGKRSAKAIAEAEEKAAKEERKASGETVDSEKPAGPKHVQNTRSKLERSGKKMREMAKLIEKDKEYSTKQALELATKTSTTKFDSTVELHVRLNVDPKQADQNIRENIVLPAGTGKKIRVAVFGEPGDVAVAKKAGADIAASDEFLQQLDKGEINFDVLVATPTVMVKLGKYARILGPKGLMPNPKSGTVTKDVAKAVEQAKAGKVEARVDEAGIVHLGVGKVSFGPEKLLENVQAIFAALKGAKPSSIKGTYVQSIYLTTTMGPSIKVSPSEL